MKRNKCFIDHSLLGNFQANEKKLTLIIEYLTVQTVQEVPVMSTAMSTANMQ